MAAGGPVLSLTDSRRPGSGAPRRVPQPRRHPPVLHMVLEALQASKRRGATSVAAIKVFILHKYPAVDVLRLKYLLRQALAAGLHQGLLARPARSKARGATGSFKLVPEPKKKTQPRKLATGTDKQPKKHPQKPGAAREKHPQKPGQSRKGPPSSRQAVGAPRKAGKTTKASLKPVPRGKAPKQPEEPRKASPKSGRARRSRGSPRGEGAASPPPSRAKKKSPRKGPPVPGQTSKALATGKKGAGGTAKQGHRKTHSQGGRSQSCLSGRVSRGDPRPSAQPRPRPQQNGAAPSTAKKQPRAPRKPAVGSRAKAASAPKEPLPPVRKTKVPQGQGQQDSRPRSSAPRAPHRKVEAEG